MTALLVLLVTTAVVLVVAERMADLTGLPTAALLTVGGLLYSLAPGPDIRIPPEAVLSLVLPPLLYSAALNSSLLAIRHNMRPIMSLSVALVLVTALVVGIGFDLVVPGATLAIGLALGAAVSPPDPVAALAVARRAGLPSRLITLIEGEGLLNDATALTVLTVAVSATTAGFSPTTAVVHFIVAIVGGAASGAGIAAMVHWLRRRIHDPLLINTISVATPFAAYLCGELLHASAVLAVVVAGLLIGHETPREVSGSSRLQTRAVWRLADFLLESFVFLLIGQQLPLVLTGLHHYSRPTLLAAAAVTLAGVLLVRPAWLLSTQWLPWRLRLRLGDPGDRGDQPLAGREVLALSWAGTRGVITITSVLTLPLTLPDGSPFPYRNLLLFCAYLVTVVTLIGHGITFGPFVRRLHLRSDPDPTELHSLARASAANAALKGLDDLDEIRELDDATVDRLRQPLNQRARAAGLRRDLAQRGSTPDATEYGRALSRAQRRLIELQRAELVRWRRTGKLSDESLRLLHNELDHEEGALYGAADQSR
jgi:monovalent cation/hydrogen antiporter